MPTLQLSDDEEVHVDNAAHLARLLDQVNREIRERGMNPRLVMLALDSGDTCHLGMGADRTVVTVIRSGNVGPYPISLAPPGEALLAECDGEDEDETIEFEFAGQDAEFLRKNSISTQAGYGALIYFLESNGQLDERIEWQI